MLLVWWPWGLWAQTLGFPGSAKIIMAHKPHTQRRALHQREPRYTEVYTVARSPLCICRHQGNFQDSHVSLGEAVRTDPACYVPRTFP